MNLVCCEFSEIVLPVMLDDECGRMLDLRSLLGTVFREAIQEGTWAGSGEVERIVETSKLPVVPNGVLSREFQRIPGDVYSVQLAFADCMAALDLLSAIERGTVSAPEVSTTYRQIHSIYGLQLAKRGIRAEVGVAVIGDDGPSGASYLSSRVLVYCTFRVDKLTTRLAGAFGVSLSQQ